MSAKSITSPKSGNIRHVAEATGVSVATVSRVMNGSELVSEKTKDKVLQACAELGYVPNSAAKALTTRRSRIIGVIIPSLAQSIFATFLGELEATCSALNYSVVIALSKGNSEQERIRAQELLAMGAEAFVLVGAEHRDSLMTLLEKRAVPCLRTSIWRQSDGVPTIGYDNEALTQNAVSYLMEKGHRRIGVLQGPKDDNARTRLRLRGVANMAKANSKLTITTHGGTLDSQGGVKATREALSQAEPPTALLGLSDSLALGALFEVPRHGLRIPQDVSVMGFDDLAWSACTNPELTTMSLPIVKMGRMVAQQLAAYLDKGEALTSTCLPADIVERNSVLELEAE